MNKEEMTLGFFMLAIVTVIVACFAWNFFLDYKVSMAKINHDCPIHK